MYTTFLQNVAVRVDFAVSRSAAVVNLRRIYVNLVMVQDVVTGERPFLMARKLLRFMPGLGTLAGSSARYRCCC